MTDFKAQTRPESVLPDSRPTRSRHRAEPARPVSPLSRTAARIGTTGRRMAVVTAACAVLVGVGAAGQGIGTPVLEAAPASETFPLSTDPLSKLNFEKVQVAVQPAAPAGDSAAPAEAVPAEAPAPAPAAEPAPAPVAPVAIDDPAGAQAYAGAQLASYGWAAAEMPCLVKLWTKESNWMTTAENPSSGAYGVVQSLPAEKMASAGADYRTNYRTQINWGLEYVKDRYGSPCGALNFHYANNWY